MDGLVVVKRVRAELREMQEQGERDQRHPRAPFERREGDLGGGGGAFHLRISYTAASFASKARRKFARRGNAFTPKSRRSNEPTKTYRTL